MMIPLNIFLNLRPKLDLIQVSIKTVSSYFFEWFLFYWSISCSFLFYISESTDDWTTHETGSGSTGTDFTDLSTTDETGSGYTGTDFTDDTTVFTSITDTTEATIDESERELTEEFIAISSVSPLHSSSKKSGIIDTISSTESSTTSDVSVSGTTETGSTEGKYYILKMFLV